MKFAMRGGKLPAIDLMKTGQNITRMRKEAGISVRELQLMFGFASPQAIYNWQNGVSLPSVDNFIFLAAILGGSPRLRGRTRDLHSRNAGFKSRGDHQSGSLVYRLIYPVVSRE